MALNFPTWLGKPILHPDHARDLNAYSAIYEFMHNMPRQEAEAKAYAEYKQRNHQQAAAHHLTGMKAAQGVGDMEQARKHGAMYALHVKALGQDPYGPVPPEIQTHIQDPKREKVYKFKAHKGDSFLLEPTVTPATETVAKSELAKGTVINGNFPQHKANPKAAGPAAPVTPIRDLHPDLEVIGSKTLPPGNLDRWTEAYWNDKRKEDPQAYFKWADEEFARRQQTGFPAASCERCKGGCCARAWHHSGEVCLHCGNDERDLRRSEITLTEALHHVYKMAKSTLRKNGHDDDPDWHQARYWWLSDHHHGQGSPEYAELSQSPYSPGPLENGVENNDIAQMHYDDMCAQAGCTHAPEHEPDKHVHAGASTAGLQMPAAKPLVN